ncbi:MAG: DsbA family protein [Pseudomonadota bacterium]
MKLSFGDIGFGALVLGLLGVGVAWPLLDRGAPLSATAPRIEAPLAREAEAPAPVPLNQPLGLDRETLHAEIRDYIIRNPEVLVEAFDVLEQRQQLAEAQADFARVRDNAEALWSDPNSFVGGNLDGEIVIVEFLDYKCGFCKRAHPEVKALIERNDDIKLIRKEFPILGPESILASRAAISVLLNDGPEAYASMSDSLMSFGGRVTENVLRRFAERAGADADAMMAKMEDVEVSRIIQSNRALGQRLGISGTPSFVFGERLVRGFLPLPQMEETVTLLRRM